MRTKLNHEITLRQLIEKCDATPHPGAVLRLEMFKANTRRQLIDYHKNKNNSDALDTLLRLSNTYPIADFVLTIGKRLPLSDDEKTTFRVMSDQWGKQQLAPSNFKKLSSRLHSIITRTELGELEVKPTGLEKESLDFDKAVFSYPLEAGQCVILYFDHEK